MLNDHCSYFILKVSLLEIENINVSLLNHPPHICVHMYNDQDVKGPAQTCYPGPGRCRCPIGPTHLHLEAQHVKDAVFGVWCHCDHSHDVTTYTLCKILRYSRRT